MVRFYILHKIIAAQFHSGFLSCNRLYSAASILPLCILCIFLVLTLHSVVCTCDNYGPYVMSTIDYIHHALLLMAVCFKSLNQTNSHFPLIDSHQYFIKAERSIFPNVEQYSSENVLLGEQYSTNISRGRDISL